MILHQPDDDLKATHASMELHNEAINAAEEWCTKDRNPKPPLHKRNSRFLNSFSNYDLLSCSSKCMHVLISWAKIICKQLKTKLLILIDNHNV